MQGLVPFFIFTQYWVLCAEGKGVRVWVGESTTMGAGAPEFTFMQFVSSEKRHTMLKEKRSLYDTRPSSTTSSCLSLKQMCIILLMCARCRPFTGDDQLFLPVLM